MDERFTLDLRTAIDQSMVEGRPLIIDQSCFGVSICDFRGRIRYANNQFAEQLGYRANELENDMSLSDLQYDTDSTACKQAFEACKNFGRFGWIYVRLKHKLGDPVIGRSKGQTVQLGPSEYMLGVFDPEN